MASHIAVILTDKDRRIQWVNEDFTQITGYALAEVIGKKPGALLHGPLTEEESVRRIRKGLEGAYPIRENITNYRKNGEAYLCKLIIHPVFNEENELTNFIAFEIDGDQVDEKEISLLHSPNKYQTSSLKGRDGLVLFNKLKKLLEAESLYLDPQISLKQLSDLLETNTKYLSQVVNLHTGNNLQVFLNTFRIAKAKERLLKEDASNLTLFGIATECGFKNKSTFYKVFKEMTGQTPQEFVRAQKKKLFRTGRE